MYNRRNIINFLYCLVITIMLCACSTTKHVPQDKLLVNKVSINVKDNKEYKGSQLINYLKQLPNHTVLGGMKLQLGLYNLSGKDSTKRINKWLRNMGEAPVIYNQSLTEASKKELRTLFINKGFMGVAIDVDTFINTKKRKIDIAYNITTGKPHHIKSISYNIPNDTLRELILADTANSKIKPNTIFDRNLLSSQRDEITKKLREKGYYAFNKEYITFTADTTEGSKDVDLTLNTMPPYNNEKMKYYTSH